MDIKTLALILLILRLVSIVFMVLVISKQAQLAHLPTKYTLGNDKYDVGRTRWALMALSIIILLGNMLPLYVDYATIVAELERSSNRINTIGVMYTLSNASTAVLSSFTIWLIYRFARKGAGQEGSK